MPRARTTPQPEPAARPVATDDQPNPALAMVDVFVAAALAAYLRQQEEPKTATADTPRRPA